MRKFILFTFNELQLCIVIPPAYKLILHLIYIQ